MQIQQIYSYVWCSALIRVITIVTESYCVLECTCEEIVVLSVVLLLFFPPCGGGEQAVLKDVLWLAWLQFIKSKVSCSGMFALKAWNKRKQNSVRSVVLPLFFFSTGSFWTQRKHDAKVQSVGVMKSVEHSSPTAVPPAFSFVFIWSICAPLPRSRSNRFSETLWDDVSLHLQLEESLYWNKLDFSVD